MADQVKSVDPTSDAYVPTANETFVEDHKISDVMVKKPQIYRVKDHDPISNAFHKIQAHKVLALPVYDEEKKRFYGFIDVLDIVNFVLSITDAYKHNKKTDWMEFLKTETKWREATCGSVKNLSQNDVYTQVMPDANISTAISLMANFDGTHRLAVVGPYPDYALLGILSQSELMKYLYDNLDHKDSLFNKTVDELKLGYRKVLHINEDAQLAKAFHLLKKHAVSGVAVINHAGELVGNVSASDIRADKEFSIESLIEFCAKTCGWLIKHREKEEGKPYPVTCSPKSTVQDVFKMFCEYKVHRVYVVGDNKKLLGVVTLNDALKLLHPKKVVWAGY